MKLQEAMLSGKKFRRPSFKPYLGETVWLEVINNEILFANTHDGWTPRVEDVTATDWVIWEEKKLSFTFEEIKSAVYRVSATTHDPEDFEEELQIALGFKPYFQAWSDEA